MATMLRAQLWELGRTTWKDIVWRLAFGFASITFAYYFVDYTRLEIRDIRGLALIMYLCLGMPATGGRNNRGRCGSDFSIPFGFTRPISTLQLVIVPLLFSVVAGLACCLIPTSLLFWLLDTSCPIAGPSALVACLVCCFIAISWPPATVVGRWIGFALTTAANLGFVFVVATPAKWIAIGEPVYWEVPWFIYVGLAVLSAIAITFTVFGVQRRRYGESLWDDLGFNLAFHSPANGRNMGRGNEMNSRRLLAEPFRNQWTAQCWYDFQQTKKWLLFPAFLVPLAIVGFVGVANHFDPSLKETFYALASSLVLCPIVCPMIVIPAACAQHPVFDSTRPMRSDHLVAIKWLMTAGWSLVGWLIMAAATFLYLRFIYDWGAVIQVGEALFAPVGAVSIYWWLVCLDTVDDTTVNTDLNMRLEFDAPLRLFQITDHSQVDKAVSRTVTSGCWKRNFQRLECGAEQLLSLESIIGKGVNSALDDGVDPSGFLELVELGAEIDPQHPFVVTFGVLLGSSRAVEESWQQLRSIGKSDPKRLLKSGMDCTRRGKFNEAEKIFRLLTELHPHSSTASAWLAQVLAATDHFPEAKAELEKVKTTDPFDGLIETAEASVSLGISE